MRSKFRPLSPYLHYRWQYTSTLSFLHRLSGVALAGAFILFVVGLIAIAFNLSEYAAIARAAGGRAGRILLLIVMASSGYHLSNGIRHLAWDAGFGFERGQARRSAWLVLLATLAILLILCVALAVRAHLP